MWQQGHGGAALSRGGWMAEAVEAQVSTFALVRSFRLCCSRAWERLMVWPQALA